MIDEPPDPPENPPDDSLEEEGWADLEAIGIHDSKLPQNLKRDKSTDNLLKNLSQILRYWIILLIIMDSGL